MATSNSKKSAPKKDNKKKVSHANKVQTGQPEIPTEPTDKSDYEPEEMEQDSEQPQEEITNEEPSIADILKKNKAN